METRRSALTKLTAATLGTVLGSSAIAEDVKKNPELLVDERTSGILHPGEIFAIVSPALKDYTVQYEELAALNEHLKPWGVEAAIVADVVLLKRK